jgi:FAD/FMN-containing dehydrogenase
VSIPFELPGFALSPTAVRAFNACYYRFHATGRHGAVVHPFRFFYPLDVLRNWQRLYGRRGFVQYQCVVPSPDVHATARRLLGLLAKQRRTSFLCILKDCGAEGGGLLSFPRSGISLALDIPMREGTQNLVDGLNDIVVNAGGRIYLAKDALSRPEHFRAMEPRLPRFLEVRRMWDPEGRIRSAQSVRLFGW